VPIRLLAPIDAKDAHGQPVACAGRHMGTANLRLKVWDGTKDEDLDNVLWHDWEKEGAALEEGAAASSSSAEHPRRQAEAVLHALWPSPT